MNTTEIILSDTKSPVITHSSKSSISRVAEDYIKFMIVNAISRQKY